MEPVEINAGEYYLRAFRDDDRVSDVAALVETYADEETKRYMHRLAIEDAQTAELFITMMNNGWAHDQRWSWAVCDAVTAEAVRQALASGNVDTLNEVVGSQMIQRLKETQSSIEGQIADLSTKLLDGHPQMKGLRSQLTGIKQQIRTETRKILASLESDANVARLREKQLMQQLNSLKADTANTDEKQVGLNALEREATAQRQHHALEHVLGGQFAALQTLTGAQGGGQPGHPHDQHTQSGTGDDQQQRREETDGGTDLDEDEQLQHRKNQKQQ